MPLHASGGKALLDPWRKRNHEHHSANRLQQFTPTTLVDSAHLAQGPGTRACELGYTVDKEEHVIGLNCIASAIYDDVGRCCRHPHLRSSSKTVTEDCFVSQGRVVETPPRATKSHGVGTESISIMSSHPALRSGFFDKN
ncbi:IclR family transcriptional regulator domain-containing protein [Shigella flexneri]